MTCLQFDILRGIRQKLHTNYPQFAEGEAGLSVGMFNRPRGCRYWKNKDPIALKGRPTG
jgi:hypothetical protein